MTELKITWKKFNEEFPKHGEDILISNDDGTM